MANATPVTAASGGQTTPVIIVSGGPATPLENVLAQGTPIQVVTSGPATPVLYSGGPQYDFTTGSLPAGMTFTRASQAWYFDGSGNTISNPTMIGGVAGSPGTVPTGWFVTASISGITRTLAYGTEDGMSYMDVRLQGTPSAPYGLQIFYEVPFSIVAAAGETWTASVFVKLLPGSVVFTQFAQQIVPYDSSNVNLGTMTQPFFDPPVGGSLASFRRTDSATLIPPTTAKTRTLLVTTLPTGVAVDFTIRVGGPTYTTTARAAVPTLRVVNIDVPRFTCDPVTGTPLGLLVEGARTNSLRNNTMVGAVAGTPGTAPTNWFGANTTANAVTRTIALGSEDGIDYIEYNFAGTPSGSGFKIIVCEATTQVAAAVGQVWSASAYMRLSAGSMSGASVTLFLVEQDGAGAQLSFGQLAVTPTSAPLRTQRPTVTRTLASATTGFVTLQIHVGHTISVPIDITLRIGLPQLEVGEVTAGTTTALLGPSSPIKTSTVAVARAVDVARLTDARVFTDKAMIIRGRIAPALPLTPNQQSFVNFDDGTGNNRKGLIRVSGTGFAAAFVQATSVNQVNMQIGAVADNADFAIAARFDTNNFAVSLNGAAAMTDVTCTMPVVTQCGVGGFPAAPQHTLFGTIKSIETRATATDAELQALSVP